MDAHIDEGTDHGSAADTVEDLYRCVPDGGLPGRGVEPSYVPRFEGGYRDRDTFVEYAEGLVDHVNTPRRPMGSRWMNSPDGLRVVHLNVLGSDRHRAKAVGSAAYLTSREGYRGRAL